jgi:cysteinyl-tRNA synthetase
VSAYDLLVKLQREQHSPHYLTDEDLKLLLELRRIDLEFHRVLSEDFNTPEAIAALSRLLTLVFRDIQYNPKYMLTTQALKTLRAANYVFALFEERVEESVESEVEALLKIIVDVRKELRKRGMYDLADTIRSELLKHGIQLMDKGLETTWIRLRR